MYLSSIFDFSRIENYDFWVIRLQRENTDTHTLENCYFMELDFNTNTKATLREKLRFVLAGNLLHYEAQKNRKNFEPIPYEKLEESIPKERENDTYYYSEKLEYWVFTQEKIKEIGIENFWYYFFNKFPVLIPYYYKMTGICIKCGDFYMYHTALTKKEIIGIYCPTCLKKILKEREDEKISDYLEYIKGFCESHSTFSENVLPYRVNESPMNLCECCIKKI